MSIVYNADKRSAITYVYEPKSYWDMKISEQFESEKTASYYAIVKTYVETCRKNNINEMKALSKLCTAAPFTIDEIFN